MRINIHPSYTWLQKLMTLAMRVFLRMGPPEIMAAMMYRSEFFGKPFSDLTQEILRGPSEWSVGERELFSAFVSHLNGCPFCVGTHGAVSGRMLGESVTEAVLRDWRTAPVNKRVYASLGFLEILTLAPEKVNGESLAPLRTAGVSDAAILDLVYVCELFCIINRIANALDFAIPSPDQFRRMAPFILRRGYRRLLTTHNKKVDN